MAGLLRQRLPHTKRRKLAMARARSSTASAVNTRTTRHDDVQCMGQRDWTLFGTVGASLSEFAAD